MNHIFDTEILCTERQAEDLANLKIMPEQRWMKIAIDLTSIITVRENLDEEGNPQVTLYTPCDNFTVKGEYEDIRAKWIMAKKPKTLKH